MSEIIKLTNEEGIEEAFELVATFGLDEDNYVALLPVDSDDELILMLKIVEDDNSEELTLVGIEDDNELNDVIDAFEELDLEE